MNCKVCKRKLFYMGMIGETEIFLCSYCRKYYYVNPENNKKKVMRLKPMEKKENETKQSMA